MKFLNQYLNFAWEPFADGKRFLCLGCKKWVDNNGTVLGTKVETVITQDKTAYGKDGSNIFEKIVFKVPSEVSIPANTEVIPQNVEATVYGDYRNQLSCIAEKIEIVTK